jgi:response regulator of citrate/malate metabolism
MADNYTHAVFIIEDHTPVLNSLEPEVKSLLRELPFSLFSFSTVEETLQSVHYPVLVLIDHHLNPQNKDAMNAFDGINALRKSFPAADFILVTADSKTELFLRSRRFPIYDYLLRDTHTNYRLGLTLDRWLKLHKYRVPEEDSSLHSKRV